MTVDRQEVLFALCDIGRQIAAGSFRLVRSMGALRNRHHDSAYNALFEEAARENEAWAPLKGGMFGGDMAGFERVKEAFTEC